MARNVFITGATSGIGEAIAHAFAQNGDNLILIGRRKERLEAIQEELETLYQATVWTYQLDVTKVDMVSDICQKILAEVEVVDILINNAGLALGLEKFQDYAVEDMLTMLDTVNDARYQCQRLTSSHSPNITTNGRKKFRSHHQYWLHCWNLCLCWSSSLFGYQSSCQGSQ